MQKNSLPLDAMLCAMDFALLKTMVYIELNVAGKFNLKKGCFCGCFRVNLRVIGERLNSID